MRLPSELCNSSSSLMENVKPMFLATAMSLMSRIELGQRLILQVSSLNYFPLKYDLNDFDFKIIDTFCICSF